MPRLLGIFLFFWTGCLAAAAAPAAEPPAARVVILANGDVPESLAVAEHYAAVRGVPRENLFAPGMPQRETITWPEFVAYIWQPLRDELVRRRWIDAIGMSGFDAVGRRKYASSGHRIAALVVCRGVPLRIDHDQRLYSPVPRSLDRPEFRTNAGAVDSELSLLAWDGVYPINAYVPNPLFHREKPSDFDRAKVVEVSRLDAPSQEDALDLVDRAVAAERDGLLGRAYVDLGGPHADGDRWLGAAADQLAALGFDESVDRARETFPPTARFDAPVLYFGWYAPNLNGPFALPGFRFPPGAIALHIHSYSAATLGSPTQGWSGPLVARGAAATVGNVYEPYLQTTHRPDLLLRALARGETLADAAYYALPALSWESILIGDPLYRPFAVPVQEQMSRLDRLPPALAGYAVLRQARLFEASGQSSRALELLRREISRRPNLAVSLALAQRLRDAGQAAGAAKVLEGPLREAPLPADGWGLFQQAAELIGELGWHGSAVQAYRRLLAIAELPPEVRARWLVDARRQALAAGDTGHADAWRRDLDDAVADILRKKP